MNLWGLPKTHRIGPHTYDLNTDYRDILEIIGYLNDNTRPEYLRWRIAVALFYDQDMPDSDMQDAMQYLADFISYGATSKPGPKLIDWEQDAQLIVSDINKIAGKDIRGLEYMHWWTFVGLFLGIGEGQLSTVVSIRHKLATGKKLEKWEREYYRDHKEVIDFREDSDPDAEAVKEYFNKWL